MEALVLLAWILPSSVVAFLWIALLDRDEGTVNVLIGQTPGVAWLVQYPMTGIVVFNIWRGTAFSMMLYAAALSSVPPSHLETARLAGSSTARALGDRRRLHLQHRDPRWRHGLLRCDLAAGTAHQPAAGVGVPACGTRRKGCEMSLARAVVGRILTYVMIGGCTAFFALPLLWLLSAR